MFPFSFSPSAFLSPSLHISPFRFFPFLLLYFYVVVVVVFFCFCFVLPFLALSINHAFCSCVRICFSSLTGLQKLAPRLVGVLIPFVIIARNTKRAGSASETYVTATTTTATIHTRQSVCVAQWLLGEGLVSPVALEATFRFPLVLVTPVKFSFTCCKKYISHGEIIPTGAYKSAKEKGRKLNSNGSFTIVRQVLANVIARLISRVLSQYFIYT